MLRRLLVALLLAAAWLSDVTAQTAPYSLRPGHVAVVINVDDPQSVAAGEQYRALRRIPARNVVRVRIPGRPHRLSAEAFATLKRSIDSQLQERIQVVVMAWTAPFAVECNSITSAYTLGFDPAQCANTCAPGRPSPLFDAPTARPFSDVGVRLSMLLPSEPAGLARTLAERGVRSDYRAPVGNAYFVTTSDPHRNTRAVFFPLPGVLPQPRTVIHTPKTDRTEDAANIMFYLTGQASVSGLDRLRFLPGALADHLTSAGGVLLGSSQMSSLRWLEAGATATYGAVSEPCNFWQKFPHPQVLLKHYLGGASAVEAYWKSVAWPAQGVFVGEPLASPYRR